MLFSNGEFIKISNCELLIEIKNLLQGDQEIHPEFKNIDRYRCLVNGMEIKLPEKFIEMLINSQVKIEKKRGVFFK
jgi:hypothetical protein